MTAPAPVDIDLLTIPEARAKLRCSANHVYALISDGVLSAVDIARPGARKSKTRVRSDEIAAYISRQTTRARTT